MIEETITIHDKYQFEIKYEYKLNEKKNVNIYDIETYLFLPSNLGINRDSYKKEDFYNDLTSYIRLKTPSILLQDMLSGSKNPYDKLKGAISNLVSEQDQTVILDYEHQIKMFCSILKTSIRDHIDFIREKTGKTDIEDLVAQYISHVEAITSKYRDLRSMINIPTIRPRVFSVFLFGDEYTSHLIEAYTFSLLEFLKSSEIDIQGSLCSKLLDLVNSELNYRKEETYQSIPAKESDNEELLFRKSVLKKYIENVLFLNVRRQKEGRVAEQVFFSVAAGLAMLFAVVITFYFQEKYGRFTMPILIILVITYVFKDRLKELLRLYFSGKAKKLFLDYRTTIFDDNRHKVGFCRESFDFMSESRVPSQVRKIRDKDHITEIENGWVGERIMHYRKRIKLFRRKLLKAFSQNYQAEGINDIMRFNVASFLGKMDDPQKSLYVSEGDEYEEINGQRVYHVNMIIKYSTKSMSLCKRSRIVLNREGIKRIEEVSSNLD
ncbi:hypothetical protein ACFL4W_01495 [Planctomycetota bacterium]